MRGKLRHGTRRRKKKRNIPAHAGKRIKTLVIIVRPRNIPAHAGKTDGSDRAYTLSAEHPRACGENLLIGTLRRVLGRNIPAHAGKTCGA